MTEILSIVNLPQTEQALKEISERCKGRLKLAEQMACTEETKQAVKKYRADLKKEFDELEAERKAKTAEYEKPLEAFKAIYRDYIALPYKQADQALKGKIDEVETAQKAAKREAIEVYAQELLQAYALDWLDVARVMPAITLSASERALKKQIKDTADKIKQDVDCINSISDNSELMAEYMKCLSLSQAKLIVVERQHAIEQAEKARSVYTQREEIKQEVTERVEQLAPPIEVEEVKEVKIYTMTFTVSGTIEQLKALKAFMIANNINFTNGCKNNG